MIAWRRSDAVVPQYVGIPTAVSLGGSKFVGLVQSVKEEVGPRWIVTIIPKQPKAASHSAAIAQMPDVNVRYRGQPGKHMLALSSSQFDPTQTFQLGCLTFTMAEHVERDMLRRRR
jgi:hypothetical protein